MANYNPWKGGRTAKTIAEYEAEAVPVGECLVHPSQAVARRVFVKRHGSPHGLMVCHSCDVPGCIRDEHHWLGTAQDNMDDKMAKGRWAGGRPKRSITA